MKSDNIIKIGGKTHTNKKTNCPKPTVLVGLDRKILLLFFDVEFRKKLKKVQMYL
jgi:hypothetical protein